MRKAYTKANYYITFIFTAIITYLPKDAYAIRCYKCVMAPPITYSNETPQLCQNFDHSEKFIVDCPYSTFCIKKDFTVILAGPINGTERDCAPQKNSVQVYDDKDDKWKMKVTVEEPYEEGCKKINDKGQRIAQPQYCYCNTDLCNGSHRITSSNFLLLLFMIIAIAPLSITSFLKI